MNVPTWRGSSPCSYLAMRQAANVLETAFEVAVAPVGLSAAQFAILRALSLRGSMSDDRLAAITGCHEISFSQDVLGLEQSGLVELREAEMCASRVRLTAAGRSGYQAAVPMWSQVERRVELLFGHPEANALHSVLRDVVLVGCSPMAPSGDEERPIPAAAKMTAMV